MGLAAGQARLLTITGRKSDCEFESMRLSHQKIALARQLADLSNEYQNSITQTKLIYDYYGTGDASNPLTYGILMKPSALNNYMPTIITDSMGRVALSSSLAAAAFKAGIPQEGLGTLPGEEMRKKFIQGLYESGEISERLKTAIDGLPYNQQAGFGGGTTVAVQTASGDYNKLCKYLSEYGCPINISIKAGDAVNKQGEVEVRKWSSSTDPVSYTIYTGSSAGTEYTQTYDLGKLLNGEETAVIRCYKKSGDGMSDDIFWNFMTIAEETVNQIVDTFSEAMDLGSPMVDSALTYAEKKIKELIFPRGDDGKVLTPNSYYNTNGSYDDQHDYTSRDYIGVVRYDYTSSSHRRHHAQLDIGNVAQAFVTYFTDFMNGVSAEDAFGRQVYDVKQGKLIQSQLAKDGDYEYTWKIGSDVSSDDLGQATFYDALFNQICMNGWTENSQVTDKDYLQQMLQNGMLYISKMKDDGYYYQGNYATDNYIKEVPDESKIAQAEAKYATEKAKLNAKEETIDLKMKNLDTEISALTTEYDTVKNTISKQIEKCFKRYNA